MTDYVMKRGWFQMRLLLLYTIAAIAGALGGCGAGAVLALTSKTKVRQMQIVAYIVIGLVTGLFVLSFGYLFGVDTDNEPTLARWALLMGLMVPLSLFSQNYAISAVLKRFGFEMEFTLRRNKEERRDHVKLVEDEEDRNR